MLPFERRISMKKLVLHSTDILNQELMLEKDLHNLYRYKNNKVIKIIRYGIEQETILQKLESHKIHKVDQLNPHSSLLYPEAVVLDENGYRGYLMDEVVPTTFSYEADPKEICNYFKTVENVMEFGHQEGIIFPDIFSHGNISYQKENHQVTFLDFDGWQIKNIPAGTSSNLPEYNEEIRSNPRFKVNGLYTKNFDRLLLLQQFLYALTKIDLFQKENIQAQLNQIYQMLNLEDDIAIQSVINTAFDFQAEDNIPKIEPIIYAIERQVNKSKKTLQKKM